MMRFHSSFKISVLLITITFIQLCNTTRNLTIDTNLILFENHGIILKNKGVVTFANDNMISIFRKVKFPMIQGPVNCNNDWVTRYNTEIYNTVDKHVKLFQDITSPNTRKKRSLLAFGIGLGVVDLLLGGIGYGSLKQHISTVEKHFNNFVTEQHQFNEKIVAFDDKVVKIISDINTELNDKLHAIQCQILDTTGELLARQFIHEWDNKIKHSLFTPLLYGAIKTPLTPEILSPNELNDILANHSSLHDTYYAKNVYNFYNVGQISLVQAHLDAITKTLTVHQVLHYPHARIGNIFPLYKTHQVGITDSKGLCVMLKIPHHMYQKNGKLYAIDDNNCKVSDGPITACFAEILSSDEPNNCLTNFNNCSINQTPCNIRYVYDTSGVLIGTGNNKINIQVFDNAPGYTKKSLKVVKPSSFSTKFISWQNASYIQVDKILVEKPSFVTQFFKYKANFSQLTAWKYKISNTSFALATPSWHYDKPNRPTVWLTFGYIGVACVVLLFIMAVLLFIILRHGTSLTTCICEKNPNEDPNPNGESGEEAEHLTNIHILP